MDEKPFAERDAYLRELEEEIGSDDGSDEYEEDMEQIPEQEESLSFQNSESGNNESPSFFEKFVLDRVDKDDNNPLPEGWLVITHASGMPLYFHQYTRVVTHSRPYKVEGKVIDHQIPVSSIPCLYRQMMDKKHKELEDYVSKCPLSFEEQRQFLEETPIGKLTTDQYQEYCQKRFKFKTKTFTHYPKSTEAAPFETPSDAISFTKRSGFKKPFILKPLKRLSVGILNDVTQRSKGELEYRCDDVAPPYQMVAMFTVDMNNIHGHPKECIEGLKIFYEIALAKDELYSAPDVSPEFKRFEIGRGVGPNKKAARLIAAKNALAKLFPKLRFDENYFCDAVLDENAIFEEDPTEYAKQLDIDCVDLVEKCNRFGVSRPYDLLRNAINRSLRWYGMKLRTTNEKTSDDQTRVILSLGTMKSEGEAVDWEQAIQLASQLLLKQMHPDLGKYGSFLEIYSEVYNGDKEDNAKQQQVARVPLVKTKSKGTQTSGKNWQRVIFRGVNPENIAACPLPQHYPGCEHQQSYQNVPRKRGRPEGNSN